MRPSEWLLVALSTIKSQSNTLTFQQQREGGTRKPVPCSETCFIMLKELIDRKTPYMVKMTLPTLGNITKDLSSFMLAIHKLGRNLKFLPKIIG